MTFVTLPFELPETTEAQAWLDEMDFVDIYFGSKEELTQLAERAPTSEIREWLERWIEQRPS